MAKTRSLPTPFFRRRIVVLTAGFVAMLAAAGGAWLAWRALPEVPVREVRFVNAAEGAFVHVDGEDLARVARAVAATRVSVLRTDLADVRAAVEQIDWVRRADVRRLLPYSIEVKIEEQVAFGIWRNAPGPRPGPGGDSEAEETVAADLLINRFGEVFKGTLAAEQLAALPVLVGPPGAAMEVLAGYEQFGKQLAPVDRRLRELRLSVRRAWTLKLDNGSTLEVGRSDAALRLARFVQAYRQIAALQLPDARLDLRYQNGLALRAASVTTAAAKPATAGKTPTKLKTRPKRT